MAVGDTFETSGRVYSVVYLVPPVLRIMGSPPAVFPSAVLAGDLYGTPGGAIDRWSSDAKRDPDGIYIFVDSERLLSGWKRYFESNRVPESYVGAGMAISVKLDQYADSADFMRSIYFAGAKRIQRIASQSVAKGQTIEKAARWVVRARNVLKVQVRLKGPLLFKTFVEARNYIKYRNPLGPTYERLRLRYTDAEIIEEKVVEISRNFNRSSSVLRVLSITAQVATFALATQQDSPESLPALPKSEDELVAIEITRLKLGIPADANIDSHGHLKKSSYLQIDLFDVHAADEIDQETEEILWFFGVPVTYTHGGVTWTVPGKSWSSK